MSVDSASLSYKERMIFPWGRVARPPSLNEWVSDYFTNINRMHYQDDLRFHYIPLTWLSHLKKIKIHDSRIPAYPNATPSLSMYYVAEFVDGLSEGEYITPPAGTRVYLRVSDHWGQFQGYKNNIKTWVLQGRPEKLEKGKLQAGYVRLDSSGKLDA